MSKLQSISNFCENDSNVLAAIIIGPQARSESPADEYSDIDVIV